MSRSKPTKSAKSVSLRPFGQAAMLQYVPRGGGKMRYHVFKRSEKIEVSRSGDLIVIRCRVRDGEIQD
ncbi:MAG: hypothetical protein JSS51_03990 [Planctomycetes bacterium]|nr:hypothetical protein [Planctomycetota bacterium]